MKLLDKIWSRMTDIVVVLCATILVAGLIGSGGMTLHWIYNFIVGLF